ncbi:MAG: hypothetical protein ACOYXT_14760 [Bacteroidota bacterium]
MTAKRNTAIVETLRLQGLIPFFNHTDVNTWEQIIDVAYHSGIRVFEFTHQRERKPELFSHIMRKCADQYPDLLIGAGTVLTAETADHYLRAGASFIGSPFLRADMADVCASHQRLWIPGCTNKQEIAEAHRLGASVVTLLAGHILGAGFLAGLTEAFPRLHFIPSGIADTHEIKLHRWFQAGALCIRMGLPIFPKEVVAIRDWRRLEQNLFSVLGVIRKIKHGIVPPPIQTLSA